MFSDPDHGSFPDFFLFALCPIFEPRTARDFSCPVSYTALSCLIRRRIRTWPPRITVVTRSGNVRVVQAHMPVPPFFLFFEATAITHRPVFSRCLGIPSPVPTPTDCVLPSTFFPPLSPSHGTLFPTLAYDTLARHPTAWHARESHAHSATRPG